MTIHPTAIISKEAELASDVEVGPYAVIEGPVKVKSGTKIGPHVYITGLTEIDERCEFHYGAAIGGPPQDLTFEKCRSYTKIGCGNIFREYATVHCGTKPESATIIGNNNYFMAFSHIAHNCSIGNEVVICHGVPLAGYVEVGDRAFISGNTAVQQHCRIGRLAMVGGLARITRDIPPFMMVDGSGGVVGINVVGLRRAGVSGEVRSAIKRAYFTLYRSSLNTSSALEHIAVDVPEVAELVDFIRSSKRGIASKGSRHWAGALERILLSYAPLRAYRLRAHAKYNDN